MVGAQKFRGSPRNSVAPTSSNHHNSERGIHVKKKFKKLNVIPQLRALATHRPILGRVAQGALELILPQIRKCHFFSDPCENGAYRDYLHIILKAHTLSNKLVSKKYLHRRKGVKVMTATNMCSNFGGLRCTFPSKPPQLKLIYNVPLSFTKLLTKWLEVPFSYIKLLKNLLKLLCDQF